ncbi:hypothetical protein MLD38_009337 [Melastoma candidum]|uniref:Uncharacterized protein n=1 Tax=Melastoma candidum TaxID=119954 RepID=A0ACB9RWD6_9MYRT|nr:hypothetical protein MLD38_009337 [Melastoma candidum]
MLLIGLIEILAAFACYVLLWRQLAGRNGLPTSWPLLGMMPGLFVNIHRVHDWVTGLLERTNCTFQLQGFWFTNTSLFITVDPANVNHIMSANFVNFPKGPEFRKIFRILGDGIFNADAESWSLQRKATQGLVTHSKFHRFLTRVTRDKIENGLMKVFDNLAETGRVVDLQDMFQRLTFDLTCELVTGFDPGCVSIDFPEVIFSRALDDAEEALFYRHLLPEWSWTLQRILGFGPEEKLRVAERDLDGCIAKYIEMKRDALEKKSPDTMDKDDGKDILSSFMLEDPKSGKHGGDAYLRDTILNLMIAGRDTTGSALTWFFYNLSEHPTVEAKIIEEIRSLIPDIGKSNLRAFEEKATLNKMVYLHAALCESLRLYPPVPFQHKSPTVPDILPSGHQVNSDTRILFHVYSMGRMKSIWGEDSSMFRPERWISDRGMIKHEPSYKFLSFNAGPRTCLGKEVAFTQMKTVVAAILHSYEVHVMKGQKVVPANSIILHMKDGLKVKITKRN